MSGQDNFRLLDTLNPTQTAYRVTSIMRTPARLLPRLPGWHNRYVRTVAWGCTFPFAMAWIMICLPALLVALYWDVRHGRYEPGQVWAQYNRLK